MHGVKTVSDAKKIDYALRGAVYAFLIAAAKEAAFGSLFGLVWCFFALCALGLSVLVEHVGKKLK